MTSTANPATFFDRVIDLYEEMPYPEVPIEDSAADTTNVQFKVNLTTAQYARTRQILKSEGATILNAGCGSGWETLIVAEANPGAHLVAIDLSPESVKVTERRLRFHGFTNIDVYAMDLLELPQLNMEFDFISCNDVLYLLDSPVEGLKALKAVLKPEGIIRTNLHNAYTRRNMLDMQEAFRILGLFDLPRARAAEAVRECMTHLTKSSSQAGGWNPAVYVSNPAIMNNYLLSGDKGFTILDTFRFLKESGLGMISLVDFPTWQFKSLFKQMPKIIEDKLEHLSQVELLHLYELFFPNGHRLIDFWAEHENSSLVFPWTDENWLEGIVMINPLLASAPNFLTNLMNAVEKQDFLEITWAGCPERLRIPAEHVTWLSRLATGPKSVQDLINTFADRNNQDREQATEKVLAYMQALEDYFFLLLSPADA
ncbi:MAG: class I SAM-dependent methyltransferase [Synechococcaceae cyanobacterium SM2_3_1]|nr:class I SAM-dependent methyltransferase [Synechococcaceae cyanobacterium SM2_3_1]